MTKTEFVAAVVARHPEMTKNDVQKLLTAMADITLESLRKNGQALIPDIVKFKVVDKPATPERKGTNPFTKQPVTIPAKPASVKLKPTVAKSLKDSFTT